MIRIPLLAATAVVACTNSTNPPNQGPPLFGGCTSVAPPMLLYPQNGATRIPTAHLTLYFAGSGSGFSPPTLTPSNGGAALTGTPYSSPSPGPTPPGMATPPPGAPLVVSQFTPGVASSTTYTVSVNNNLCGPFTEGSFTTQ